MALTQAMLLANFGLAGGVAGCLFPKRAVRGVCLGLAVFWLGWIAVMGVGGVGLWGRGGLWWFLSYWVYDSWTLTAIISAWVGSRARLAWTGRTRAARN